MSICLIDTSIFVEILKVPGKCSRHGEIVAALKGKIEASEKLFLPVATIVETGNHIAQSSDGRQRRTCAERFVKQVGLAISGESPFNPISYDSYAAMGDWLANFPDFAMQGVAFADLSIIQDFERMCRRHPRRPVYIWSLDQHLTGYRHPNT
ncbi:MAG: hypothetical protein KF886_06910 [Candidatus Hydrogenedentes bacterium]|nr:hypothetical protein [Candidatus Hydrogenedentota bacterium]